MNLYTKIKKRISSEIVRKFRAKSFYSIIYKSFWHSKYHKPITTKTHQNYLTVVPNQGAGIGHQMANWIAGYWFAQQFELKFCHIPFSTQKWEDFLGFGEGEIILSALVKNEGYKKVKLPLFKETELQEIGLIKSIIASYQDEKVIFVAEQDQYYKNQFDNIEELKQKFYNAKARKNDVLVYNKEHFNIAIHIRRGDIVQGKIKNNPNLTMRWLSNNYFETLLQSVLDYLKTNKEVHIYLFSQGIESDFASFKHFSNLHFCLDMNAQDSFLHMVMADVLITSKSSFSYKPSLLNKGIKVVPKDFWHGYPKTKDFILADNAGNLLLKEQNEIKIY